MELTHHGHAMFTLDSGGTTVVIDPFNDDIGHPRPTVAPDAVVITHEHFDHNNVGLVGGRPRVIRGLTNEGKDWARLDATVGPFRITGVPTYHDRQQGAARGKNTVVIVEVEGLRLVHLGDLGHVLTDEQVRQIGRPDVLMIPVGGHYTCEREDVETVIRQLQPRVVVPMHFKTEANASWPIGTLDDFLAGRPARRAGRTVTVTPQTLPPAQEIWALV